MMPIDESCAVMNSSRLTDKDLTDRFGETKCDYINKSLESMKERCGCRVGPGTHSDPSIRDEV